MECILGHSLLTFLIRSTREAKSEGKAARTGEASMVDVSGKKATKRTAVAGATVLLGAGATQGEEARAELAPEHAADASAEDWSWQSEISARGGTSSAIDEPH